MRRQAATSCDLQAAGRQRISPRRLWQTQRATPTSSKHQEADRCERTLRSASGATKSALGGCKYLFSSLFRWNGIDPIWRKNTSELPCRHRGQNVQGLKLDPEDPQKPADDALNPSPRTPSPPSRYLTWLIMRPRKLGHIISKV